MYLATNFQQILEMLSKFQTFFNKKWGWSSGAMVLDKFPVPGRPTFWIIVGQGPTALSVGVGGVVWTFFLLSIISFFFLPLSRRRPDIH